ncbi:serine protease grass-like, partial [Wyeomyia smithii]|uniref:serine protease grass-like n=1 Tax=Wyeomyia smithii TaxID=174621 RepID=UPI002467F834
GLCVAIQRCQNIYEIVQSPNPPSKNHANYIRNAACNIPGVERSICCQLEEVAPEVKSSDQAINLLPSDCGQSSSDRIANGKDTQVFDYPWMALLRYNKNGELVDLCGGSLISNRYVLTAAHCWKNSSSLKIDHVRLGEHTRNQEKDCIDCDEGEETECAEPVEDYQIESSITHPKYNRREFSNDIALIRLARIVEFKDHIRPICLPTSPELRSKQLDKYIVTGWGLTEK